MRCLYRRRFRHPRCPYGHIGENGQFIATVVGNVEFVDWLNGVKQAFVLNEAKHKSTQVYCIAMVCKSGTHRSVACARIADYVFEELGYETYGPRHVNKVHHAIRGYCNWKCKVCQMPGIKALKVSALHKALGLWKALK